MSVLVAVIHFRVGFFQVIDNFDSEQQLLAALV
jgi:hypothetical protein